MFKKWRNGEMEKDERKMKGWETAYYTY